MISDDRNSELTWPELYGLVLTGGKSQRMGSDKAALQWHGREQRYYMADVLSGFCKGVYLSCRADQVNDVDPGYQTLPDTVSGAGPLVGILSAFRARPDAAWLVVACDLPLLDQSTLRFLINNRQANCIATTFKSPHDGLPEPLVTIWEPAACPVLESHLTGGFTCPRKALIRNEQKVNILIPPAAESLMNANTPEDAAKAWGLIHQRQKY